MSVYQWSCYNAAIIVAFAIDTTNFARKFNGVLFDNWMPVFIRRKSVEITDGITRPV